ETPISAKQIEAAIDLVRSAREGMKFLTALTVKERKAAPRVTSAVLALMEEAVQGVRENPDVLPACLDFNAYAAEVEKCRALFNLLKQLQELTADVQDTLSSAGREAHGMTAQVRGVIKTVAKTKPTPGLKLLSRRLNPKTTRAAEEPAAGQPAAAAPTPV